MEKAQDLELPGNIKAKYDAGRRLFLASFEYDGRNIDLEIKSDPDDKEAIESIKKDFEILHSGLVLWDKVWTATLLENVISRLHKITSLPPEICLIAEDIYKLIKIDLIMTDEGIVLTKVTYGPEHSEDMNVPTVGVIGNFEHGFHEFFAGDKLLKDVSMKEDHVFGNGDIAEYDIEKGCYATTRGFANDIVDFLFESEDTARAFEIYEELIKKDEYYDKLARSLISGRYKTIKKILGEDVEVDELYLATITISGDGSIEFEYRSDMTLQPISIPVRGKFPDGFTELDIDIE